MKSRLNNTYQRNLSSYEKPKTKIKREIPNNIEDNEDDKYTNDSSYYNFQVLKQLNRDFLNSEINLPKPSISINNDDDIKNKTNLSLADNKINYSKYDERRTKELKSLISKINHIINEDLAYDTTDIEEEEETDRKGKREEEIDTNSNYTDSDMNYHRYYRNEKKNGSNKYNIREKERTLKQFKKDLLKFSTLLENKKKQLNNRELRIRRQESKIKSVLNEFDRVVNDDKMWKKDVDNLRKNYQLSIDILNRENKRLIDSLNEFSNNEEELKSEIQQKDKEIEDLKAINTNITEEKNKVQKTINELKIEITNLKEKIKEMQNENTILHENYEKLSNNKKEKKKKNVEVTAKPEYHSIETQTENSYVLEKIINQQYMDIKKLYLLLHYILTLYNKNNMEDNEYRILWNDIRTKFFKNKELKEIKVCPLIL